MGHPMFAITEKQISDNNHLKNLECDVCGLI